VIDPDSTVEHLNADAFGVAPQVAQSGRDQVLVATCDRGTKVFFARGEDDPEVTLGGD